MSIYSAFPIAEKNWALSLEVGSSERYKQKNNAPVAIHYVVDNSKSMGSMTKQVSDIFSEMVDSVATAPCSLTVFESSAHNLSSDIKTGQEMRDLTIPPQGGTNIPAGIERALHIIYGQEMKARATQTPIRTHHILVLLSDGLHNRGPTPDEVFPTIGDAIPEGTKLSVVVVGYTRNSSTSMGMLLKKSIETIAFQADLVKTIYFATTRTAMQTALSSLETGLNRALKGSIHHVETLAPSLIENFASEPLSKVQVHLTSDSSSIILLCAADAPPETLIVDGDELTVSISNDLSIESLSRLIQGLIDRTKIQVVASKNNSRELISKSVKQLDALVKVLEAQSMSKKDIRLSASSAKDRVKQYREIKTICHGARALRNQVLDIANFKNEGSESQASFLNGRNMKYANKALRRANKGEDGIVDPKTERKAIRKELTSETFRDKLRQKMADDTMEHILRLSNEQFATVLVPLIRASNGAHALQAMEIRKKAAAHKQHSDGEISIDDLGLSPNAQTLIDSGSLADYLNDALHGKRQSYLSLSTPWEHLEEWNHYEDQTFESTWEMLMYGGFVGYPILLERSAASQMNPFLLQVKDVRSTLVDTASICCANQAEIPVYGPEAGEPIQDVLVLVDPSMPRSSKMICGNTLLGEKFTSATIARDLHMYSGVNMRIALHSNSLFHLIASPEQEVVREDVIANLHRAFLGRAFMCPSCGFGPLDHFACSDLSAHDGEVVASGVSINNACPRCDWFSGDISDWKPWDGAVCDEFIKSSLEEQNSKNASGSIFLSEAKIDLVLRIVYSFRKMCSGSRYQEYSTMVENMARDVDQDFTAKAGFDGLSQVLMALLSTCGDSDNKFGSEALGDVSLVTVIEEACAREARARFRKQSGGDKVLARKKAIAYIKNLLGIEEHTAPYALSPMVAEPPIENVRLDCDTSYDLNVQLVQTEISWVRGIVKKWCKVWSFARGFSKIISSRVGGWTKLEEDMETSYANYSDVIESLKKVKLELPKTMFGMDPFEIQSMFSRMAVGGIMSGAADTPCKSDVHEDQEIIHEAAREMRMLIYLQRVSAKMDVWKLEGERETFVRARAADLAQYCDMVGAKPHIHGFDKQTFWGLWLAANNSNDEGKIAAFLATANEEFHFKHGS